MLGGLGGQIASSALASKLGGKYNYIFMLASGQSFTSLHVRSSSKGGAKGKLPRSSMASPRNIAESLNFYQYYYF